MNEKVAVLLGDAALTQLAGAIRDNQAEEGRKHETFWLFVWPPKSDVRSAPIFGDWRCYGDIRAGLETLGLANAYELAFGEAITKGGVKTNVVDLSSAKTIIAVIGVWRPQPMRANAFGLSLDPEARQLEVRAYRIVGSGTEEPIKDHHVATAIVGHTFASPEVFRFASGVAPPPALALIGAGALGSAIAEDLLRSGAEDLSVFDNDVIQPHNFARHVGRTNSLFDAKPEAVAELARAITHPNFGPRIGVNPTDITASDDVQLADLFAARPVIDATASERVRRRLARFQQTAPLTVQRCEIYHRGRLGVLFQSHQSEADLVDLYGCLLLAAQHEPAIRGWLADEHASPAALDHLQFGFGCSSRTLQLPNYVVRQHASAFMPTLVRQAGRSFVGINPLDEEFRPRGWRSIDVPPFEVWTPTASPGWRVRMRCPGPSQQTLAHSARRQLSVVGVHARGHRQSRSQHHNRD